MNTPRTDAVLSAPEIRVSWFQQRMTQTVIEHSRQLERELMAEQEKVKQLREALAGLVAYIDSDAMNDYPPSVWGAYPPDVMQSTRAILEKTK